MAKFYDENGAEVDAFTQVDLDAKISEFDGTHKEAVSKLQTELDEAKVKIEEAEKNGMNEGQKERLKKAKEDAEGKLNDEVSNLSKELAEMRETFIAGTKNKVINSLAKGDIATKEKIELKYASLMKTGDYKNDEAGITHALTEAATLVMGSKPTQGFMDNMSGAGERGSAQADGKASVESENAKAMRVAFGIKDSDVAKVESQLI